MSDTIYGNIVGGGSGVETQADWNQNDQTKADYIKNRPFYEESIKSSYISLQLKGVGIYSNMSGGSLGFYVGGVCNYLLLLNGEKVGEYSTEIISGSKFGWNNELLYDENHKIYVVDHAYYNSDTLSMERKNDGFVYGCDDTTNTFDTIVITGISRQNVEIHKLDNKYVDIDNEYDGKSEKPQSGLAVKQAIQTVQDSIQNISNNKTTIANVSGGFCGGNDTMVANGGAIGAGAESGSGGAIGAGALSLSGAAVGENAICNGDGAAIGKEAQATTNCIQIGKGTNTEEGTTQIYDKKLLDKDGFIVPDRFPSGVINDKFELWNDITLGEDVQSVSITRTDDGKPIKIKKLLLYFFGQINEQGVFALRYNNGQYYQNWTSITPDDNIFGFWIKSEKIIDNLFISYFPDSRILNIDGSSGQSQGISAQERTLKSGFSYLPKRESPNSFIFGGASSNPDLRMMAGSRILVWGVQDD